MIETTKPTSIRLVNTIGETVFERTINGITSIDASGLSAGIYFVQDASGAVMKLVKN